MNIYKVREEVLNILNNIDTLEEELTDLRSNRDRDYESEVALEHQIDAYEDTLESLEFDLAELVEEIVKDKKNHDSMASAFGKEKADFALKERWAKERSGRDSELLMFIMKTHGKRKITGDLFTTSIQKNGGLRSIDLRCSPENLPERFRITKTEYLLNQYEARKALDAGESELPFEYKPQGEHIVIR